MTNIRQITLRYLFGVNCYVLTAADGFVLIDTGLAASWSGPKRP